VITYNTLFKLLHDAGRTEQLPRLLQEMRGHGVEFNEYTYGILAHSYVRARQYALAMQTLSEAESRGVRPNVELFNIKLMAYRAQGDVTKLRQVFFIDMPRANITPDAYSWSILLTASFKYEYVAALLPNLVINTRTLTEPWKKRKNSWNCCKSKLLNLI
jgi:pentatricopeptide repeat protein